MSIFGKIGTWLIGLFNKARPGLETFLHDNEAVAVEKIGELVKTFEGKPLNEWRDEAFKLVGEAVQGGLTNPGTWITILYNLGYDIYKANEAKAAAPQAPPVAS